MHYARWKRHGDPNELKVNQDPYSYDAIHYRVKRVRGRADAHQCVAPGCTERARNWAWLRIGEGREGVNPRGYTIRWGVDLNDYAPMCYSHARMMDAGGSLTHCPKGHERAVAGRVGKGKCRECRRTR